MRSNPIRIERLLDAPVRGVWKAITDKNEMKSWYFDLNEFKAESSSTITKPKHWFNLRLNNQMIKTIHIFGKQFL